jgi:dihydroxy-acid dehydratase
MASAIETLGMALPYDSSSPAVSEEKFSECARLGPAIRKLLEIDLKPRDIMTRRAFENAITIVIALGGSTNAVLHLIAMAKAAGVPLTIDDFQKISDKTPYLADLKPSGKFVMEDLHAVGGVPAVQKLLLKEGFLHGDCMTVTGKTLAENVADLPGLQEGQTIIHPVAKPLKDSGHIRILYGNIATEGAVAKITGKEGLSFTGPARVYDSEEETLHALERKEIAAGDVVLQAVDAQQPFGAAEGVGHHSEATRGDDQIADGQVADVDGGCDGRARDAMQAHRWRSVERQAQQLRDFRQDG